MVLIMFDIRQGDSLEMIKYILSGSVDLIITDPPYESLEKWREIGTTKRLKR